MKIIIYINYCILNRIIIQKAFNPEDYSIEINNSIKTSKISFKIYKGREIEHHSNNFISVIELENHDLILLLMKQQSLK